jgi:hypothetical protein
MQIELSQDLLKEATEKAIASAVKNSLDSYSVRKTIEDGITSSVLVTTIDETVQGAMSQLDISGLQQAIATEISKAVASMTVGLIRETGIDLIFAIKYKQNYMNDADKKRAKAEIEAKYFNKVSSASDVPVNTLDL